MNVMRARYSLGGRGHSPADPNACLLIETGEGNVLEITARHGNAEFIVGYCRKALADRWGVCAFEPFRRASDPGLTRSWAERFAAGMFNFRGVRLHLTREEEWMRREE